MPKRVRTHVNPLSITHPEYFDGFGNQKPLWVDVGAFKGEFIEALVKKHPGTYGLALEIRRPILEQLKQRFSNQPNITCRGGDAGLNFAKLLCPSLDQGSELYGVFVNFPDPWFKDKHKKRRFITTSFLDKIAAWFPTQTPIYFQTDQAFLFEETLECVRASDFKNIVRYNVSPFDLQTDWEKAKIAAGDEIYRMYFSLEPISPQRSLL